MLTEESLRFLPKFDSLLSMMGFSSFVSLVSMLFLVAPLIGAFSPTIGILKTMTPRASSILLMGDEVDRELEKARALLKVAKAQLEAMDRGEDPTPIVEEAENANVDPLPFFAADGTSGTSQDKREIVLKSQNKDGLITVNGDEMAKLSEDETWKSRPLAEVFENELKEDEDVYSIATQQLGGRDVAASIWSLRKSMKTEDYQKIFDKKNYFIGDDV